MYSNEIAAWGSSLSADGDLLILGCNLAASEDGKTLMESLGALTGADVAASEDLTGHRDLGGDWELEFQLGQIENGIAFSEQVQTEWHGLLANPVAADDEVAVQPTTVTNIDVLADNGSGADSDADGDPLSISEIEGIAVSAGDTVTLGSGTQITLRLDGTLDVLGATGMADKEAFTYTISDGNGGSDSATVTLRRDTDGDSVIDALDIDDDNDGITDLMERDQAGIDLITNGSFEPSDGTSDAMPVLSGDNFTITLPGWNIIGDIDIGDATVFGNPDAITFTTGEQLLDLLGNDPLEVGGTTPGMILADQPGYVPQRS